MEFLKTIMAFWDFSQNLDRSFWHGKFTAEKSLLMSFKNTCNYREKQSVWALYLMYIKFELNHATQIFQNHLSWANVLSRAICTCFIWMYIHISGFVPVALLFAPFDLNLRIFIHNFCYNNHSPRHQNFCLISVCGDSVCWGGRGCLIDQYGAKGGEGGGLTFSFPS